MTIAESQDYYAEAVNLVADRLDVIATIEDLDDKRDKLIATLRMAAYWFAKDTMAQRKYDSTVARIAGNIASGFASKEDWRMTMLTNPDAIAEWAKSVVLLSVGLARAIVAETIRTEPPVGEP